MSLNVLDVIEFGGKRIMDVNYDDLPVRLSFIEKCHDTKNLDLLDLTCVANQLTDFADVERVVVTLGLGLWMNLVWILPCL